MNIHFEKANLSHIDIIFGWLAEPYVQEFWDNAQGHKDDILNFVNGRKEPSDYCDGKYVYRKNADEYDKAKGANA